VKTSYTAIALVALAATLSACSSGPRGPSNRVIERALTGAPGAAQPSTIVAAELAFARAARDEGQWTAFREFSAPGALLHGAGGIIAAAPFLEGRSDPDEAVQWGVRTVAMSCDGEFAVSQGRFRDPAGLVGTYVTIWQRQSDNEYRWIYDGASADVPQPPPRAQVEDGAIDAIEGLVASCPRFDETIPSPPTDSPVGMRASDVKQSSDGTLRWRYQHRANGEKFVAAEYFYEGQWLTAIDETLAAPAGS
jgi:hypothetical protein